MGYRDHFRLADDIVTHLNTIVPTLTDPFLISRYVGFVSVTSVTVYELAVKEIFIDFGTKKNVVFGEFIRGHFSRLNGNISINSLKGQHIKLFGEKYLQRFDKKLKATDNIYIKTTKKSIISCYSNIIVWRNDFAHEGNLSTNVTFQEVTDAYEIGKNVIYCLADSLKR
jgi:hypothetical protein